MTTPDENPVAEPVNEVAPVPAQAPAQAYAAPNPYPNTWMNIVSLVTALLGMAIVPVIFGHLGVSAANKGKAELKGLGIAGLVIGYLEIVVGLIVAAVFIGAIIASSDAGY